MGNGSGGTFGILMLELPGIRCGAWVWRFSWDTGDGADGYMWGLGLAELSGYWGLSRQVCGGVEGGTGSDIEICQRHTEG